jgi:NADPH2:quinone reductase
MADVIYHGSGRFTVEEGFESECDGEVVEMRFSGLNPLDARLLRGAMDRGIEVPFVPGIEGSGYWEGNPVIVSGSGVGTSRHGTMRRRAFVPRLAIHPIPDWLDLRVASVLGSAGVTAWCLVRTEAAIDDSDVVLVLGASGGVGSLAVQLALASGAEVWGQTGDAEKAPMIAGLGATPLVADSPEAIVSRRDLKPTVVLDGLGGGFTGASLRLLAPGGRIHVFGASAGAEATVDVLRLYRTYATIRGYASMTETPGQVHSALVGLLDALQVGSLIVLIDRVVPLERLEDALAALEGRQVRGKLVLEIGVDEGHSAHAL